MDCRPFPTPFEMPPSIVGHLVSASVSTEGEVRVSGQFMVYVFGCIGGLTIGKRDLLDELEIAEIDRLIDLCGRGNWALSGLRYEMRDGSFAQMLVIDAIVACDEGAA